MFRNFYPNKFYRCTTPTTAVKGALSKAVSDPGHLHTMSTGLMYSADEWQIHTAFSVGYIFILFIVKL